MEPLLNSEHIASLQIGIMSEIQPDEEKKNHESIKAIPFSFLYYVEALYKKLGFSIIQTPQCKHRSGCIPAGISSSLKAGFFGYLIKSGIGFIFNLKGSLKNPKKMFNPFISKDSLSFGGFGFLFVIVFRSMVCSLRRKLEPEKQKYIFFLAGLVAGTLSVTILEKKSRQTYALFLLARALDSIYHTLVQKKILPDFKYYYVFIYSLMMMVTGGLTFGYEPAAMSSDLQKFYLMFTSESLNDMQMRRIWVERKNNELAKRGIEKYDPLDYMPPLKKYLQKNKN